MAEILNIGYPEKRESGWLVNRYFPSKVGGKPAWLELECLPETSKLICPDCKKPKKFLCQIYAALDDASSFHRTIYVFVCCSESCQDSNSARNLTVLRSQLPRKNKFYSESPPVEQGKPEPPIPSLKRLCHICGCVGPFACGRCKKIHYCTPEHQKLHWPYHKKICGKDDTQDDESAEITFVPAALFPEWEISIEEEEEASEDCAERSCHSDDESDDNSAEENTPKLEQLRLAQFEKLVAEGKDGVLKDVEPSELEKYAMVDENADEKYFQKFKATIKGDQEQIVRYKRGGEPLWIADPSRTVSKQLNIPNCENCGGKRQFEFQIMPQLLLLLKDDRIDWGVLVVYTCTNSCVPAAGAGYVQEYAIKQDILVANESV